MSDFLDSIPDAPAVTHGSPYATIDPAVLASRQPVDASGKPTAAPVVEGGANDDRYGVFDKTANFLRDVEQSDWIAPAMWRKATELGFTPDPNYKTPEWGSEEYKRLTDGIAPEYTNRLSAAVSASHAQWLRQNILDEQAAEQRLASYGAWGVAGRMATNLLDPVALAVGAASGGIGVLSKGGRIAKILTAAGSGALANTAISAAVDSGTPTRDYSDLGYAALMGAGLGAVGGTWATQLEKNLARRLTTQVTTRLEAQEAIRFLNERNIDVPPELAKKAKAPVADLTKSGPDAGAAGTSGNVADYEELARTVGAGDDVAQTFGSKFRLDIAARLRGSDDPEVRSLLGKLVGDPVGTGSEAVTETGASEVAQRLEHSYLARFYTAVDEHLHAWAKENGTSATSFSDRSRFMEEVAHYVRTGEGEDANVRGFGDKVSKLLNDIREDAKAAGVKGFDTIPANEHYLPRQIDHTEVERWNRDYGTDTVNQALEGAIRAANPHLPDEAIFKIAEGYHQRLREVGRGIDANSMHGLRLEDPNFVRELILEGGGDHDLADRVQKSMTEEMQARGSTAERGTVRFAKSRLDFDEGHTVRMLNKSTGQVDELPISSLFNGNTEELVNRYAGVMSGHIGLAKEAGIKSVADFEARLKDVRRVIADPGKRESTVQAAQLAYSLITKSPVEAADADSFAASMARWGRVLRALNYTRQMGSMIWAHLGEMGKVIAYGNLRAVMQHMPLLRSALGGGMDKELAREIVETMGLGTEHLIDRRFVQGNDPLGSAIYNATNRAMQKLTRAVSVGQGFSHTISAMQVLAGKVSAQRLLNGALREGSEYTTKQLAWMGMDAEMAGRVHEQLRTHATTTEGIGGHQLNAANLANWTDLDARDAFIAAVRKDATRMVQTNEVGSQLASKAFGHSTLSKIVLQFRSYLINAYAKSTMQGLAQGDAEAYLRFASSSVWAGLVYTAEQTLKREAYKGASALVGNNQTAERTKKYDDDLSLEEIAKAGFARAGLFSLLPDIADSAYRMAGHKTGFFNKRVSGLQSGFSLDSNPTISTIDGFQRSVGNLAGNHNSMTQGDLRFWMGLLPFRNMTGVGQALDALADKANLPKKDK